MNAKKTNLWLDVEKEIESGTFPPVFISRAGKLALGSTGKELPTKIAALYPPEIRAAAEAQAATRAAEAQAAHQAVLAEIAEREARKQAVIAEFGARRVWRLAGLYVDELSTARYTWHEIASWLAWDAYSLRHNHAQVTAICERGGADGEDFHVDISSHFGNPSGDRVRTPSFETLCRRLRDYTADARANMAGRN